MATGAEETERGPLTFALESAQRVLARHQDEPAWLQLFVRVAYAVEELSRDAPVSASRAFFAQSNPEVFARLLTDWLARRDSRVHDYPGMQDALADLRAALDSASPAAPVPPAPAPAVVVPPPAPRAEGAAVVSRAELLSAGLSTVEVAERLGMTRQAVNQRRAKGRLLGLSRGREFVYPAWQFDAVTGEVPAALEQALALLGSASDEAKARFFVEPAPELGGASPLSLLQSGRGDEVIVAAAKASERLAG